MADDKSADRLAQAVDRVLEEHAPGFTERIVGKVIQRPSDLEASDANLHTGAVNGGTSQLFQQLIFRPVPGLGSSETPVENVYLGSAGANPGGGARRLRTQCRAARAGERWAERLAAQAAQSHGDVTDQSVRHRSATASGVSQMPGEEHVQSSAAKLGTRCGRPEGAEWE